MVTGGRTVYSEVFHTSLEHVTKLQAKHGLQFSTAITTMSKPANNKHIIMNTYIHPMTTNRPIAFTMQEASDSSVQLL